MKLSFPNLKLATRPNKPRLLGQTMVLDKHLGLHGAEDLVATAGQYVDVVKLGWGSSLLYPEDVLVKKIAIYKEAGIKVCTGGTFAEIAFELGQFDEFLQRAKELGFDAIEISNGIHESLVGSTKQALIKQAVAAGFYTVSEVGRKLVNEDAALTYKDRVDEVKADLAAGASKVIMESRESGTVGIFNVDGKVNTALAYELFQSIDPHDIIWEAPNKEQQTWLIQQLGTDVNIGNVRPDEAISLESLRQGLRADTFRDHQATARIVYLELGVGGALRAKRRDDIVVMVDAIRASATIIQCLEQGAVSVTPVVSADLLSGDVTIGERGGERLPNADFGNSPIEIQKQNLQGKEVCFSSTNGAECICTAKGDTNQVLIGSPNNAAAVAKIAVRLAEQSGKNITLLAAGRNNLPAIEDRIGITEILKNIHNPIVRGIIEPHYTDSIEREFVSSDSGMNLARIGFVKDAIFCSQLNISELVPVYNGQTIKIYQDAQHGAKHG